MSEEKLRLILEAMQGITYLEWKKLKHCIDTQFNADTSAAANYVALAGTEKIAEAYKCEFS